MQWKRQNMSKQCYHQKSEMMKYISLHQEIARFACRWWAWLRSKMVCSSPGAVIRVQIAAKRGSANSLISSGLFHQCSRSLLHRRSSSVVGLPFFTLTLYHQHDIDITFFVPSSLGSKSSPQESCQASPSLILGLLRSWATCGTCHHCFSLQQMKQIELVNKCNHFKPLRWMPFHPPGTPAQHHQQAAILGEKSTHKKNKSFKKTHPWGRQLAAPPDFLGPHSQAAWAMPAASSHDLQI